MTRLARGVTAALLALAGCGGTPPVVSGSAAAPPASSGTEAERYFPLVEGEIRQYRTIRYDEQGGAEEGVLGVRMARTGPREGALVTGNTRRRFAYADGGVQTWGPTGTTGWVLKLPLSSGTSWPGEHGGETRIAASGLRVTVPAGTYEGCITTLEERRGDRPMRVTSTYCPDVGLVGLEAQAGALVERAELVYAGPPIDLGPDGARRLE